jgi:hypothetical protein
MEDLRLVALLRDSFIKEILVIIKTGKFIDGEKQLDSSKEKFVGGMSLIEKALHTLCEKEGVYYEEAKRLLELNFSRLVPYACGNVEWRVRKGYKITYRR